MGREEKSIEENRREEERGEEERRGEREEREERKVSVRGKGATPFSPLRETE